MKRLWLLVCLLGLHAACQKETPPPAIETGGDAAPGVGGVVFAESDVMSEPDSLLVEQLVVILTRDALRLVVGEDVSLQDLRFMRVTIPAMTAGLQIAKTAEDGSYAFTLTPGEYILCLADADRPSESDFPLTTRGCGQVSLTDNRMQRVDIASGFGEIVLVEP